MCGKKLPTLPKFVAEWLDYCKARGLFLWGAFDPVDHFGESLSEGFKGDLKKSLDWVKRNQDTFARAWLDGFTVEKEKLYTVEIPNPNIIGNVHLVLMKNGFKQIVVVKVFGDDWVKSKGHQLTETEIKQGFAWAWEQKFHKEVG